MKTQMIVIALSLRVVTTHAQTPELPSTCYMGGELNLVGAPNGVVAQHLRLGKIGLIAANAAGKNGAGDTELRTTAEADDTLRQKTQNPVSDLISLPLQNNSDFGIGQNDAARWVLNVQPVVPFNLTEDWNLITRIITPIIDQESPATGVSSAFGLGDVNPTFFIAPAQPSFLIWCVGPTLTLPSGSEPMLTSGKWAAGPAAVVLNGTRLLSS